jgi:hypothetical protein
LTNLVVFKMLRFNIILGMDYRSTMWVSTVKISRLYSNHLVTRSSSFVDLECELLCHSFQKFKQLRRCITEGTQADFAYVLSKPKVEVKLEDILVVHDFPNVFTETSRGLLSD